MTPRRLTAADAPALARLEDVCFSEPWSEAGLLAELENPLSSLWGIDGPEGVVAYGGWQNVVGEGYVLNIGVLPSHRRKGHGEAILRAMLSEAEVSAEFLTLEVRAGNAPAIALYEKLGFTPVGRRKDFYRDPVEDALLMTRFFDKGEGK